MNVENDLTKPILPSICRSAKNRRIGSNATIFSLSARGSWPANVAGLVPDRQAGSNRGLAENCRASQTLEFPPNP
jgi:hypothetical protein